MDGLTSYSAPSSEIDDLTDEIPWLPFAEGRPCAAPDFCPVHRKSYVKCGCADDWENDE